MPSPLFHLEATANIHSPAGGLDGLLGGALAGRGAGLLGALAIERALFLGLSSLGGGGAGILGAG